MRFYHKRDLFDDVRPHKWTFRVWFQSMSMRYKIEMIFFIICTMAFQFYIGLFVEEFYDTGCTFSRLESLIPEKILLDNPGFCPVDKPREDFDLTCCVDGRGKILSSVELPD